MARYPKLVKTDNKTLLAAALEGLELQKQRIEEQIRSVRSMLGAGGRAPAVATKAAAPAPRKRRKMSAAARKSIAAAQKKRWAEYHKKQAAESK